MSTQCDPEAVVSVAGESDEAYELQEHEFTLELEEVPAPTQSRMMPPPPPRRSAGVVEDGDRRQRSRTGSGVFAVVPAAQADPTREAVTRLRAELGRLQAQMRARDAYLRELERALDERTRQLAAAGLESLEDVARLFGRVRGQAFRIAELDAEVRRLNAALSEQQRTAGRAQVAGGDDLRRIRGVGPRFAQQLVELGYTSFPQIAAWNEAELARVARCLRITPSRIAREAWVDQARGLCPVAG